MPNELERGCPPGAGSPMCQGSGGGTGGGAFVIISNLTSAIAVNSAGAQSHRLIMGPRYYFLIIGAIVEYQADFFNMINNDILSIF